MRDTIDLEEAFNIRDQYCCLQLLTSILTSGNLQEDTSSIYSSLSGEKVLRQILLNMFYIPNAMIDYKDSKVLSTLLVDHSQGNLDINTVESTTAIMSDKYAEILVQESGDESQSTQLISVTIGKAAYRCVFSELNVTCHLDDISYVENILPNTEQSKSITLAMLIIANNTALRWSVNNTKNESALADLLGSIDVGENFEKIDHEQSTNLAKLILANHVPQLVNFVGQTMHHVTW